MEDTNRDARENRDLAEYNPPMSYRDDIDHERNSWGWNRWMSVLKSWFVFTFSSKTIVDDRTFPNSVGTQDERFFRDKLDRCSETDIIKECEKLNHAIRATSLTLVDEWSRSPRNHDYLAQISPSADDQGDLHHVLGASLLRLIEHNRSPSLFRKLEGCVTDALQAVAVEMCFETISRTFCPCLSPVTNHEMQKTFDEMISRESQAKALHWRALTYGYSCHNNDIETVIAERIKTMEHYFSSTFILAGEEPGSAFMSKIHEVITERQIVESAVTLSGALKTGLFSVHLDVYRVAPDLVDVREEPREGSCVLCTTQLGIREIIPNNVRAVQERILLEPKVIYETAAVVNADSSAQNDVLMDGNFGLV